MSENDSGNSIAEPIKILVPDRTILRVNQPSATVESTRGIMLPSREIVTSVNANVPHQATEVGILIPAAAHIKKEIIKPKEADVSSYSPIEEESPTTKRTASELALIMTNPRLFLVREVTNKLNSHENVIAQEVLENIHIGNESTARTKIYSPEVLKRRIEKTTFYNKSSNSKQELEKSLPGAFELVACKIIPLLKESALPSDSIIFPVTGLLKEYRLSQGLTEAPEMPDLTEQVIDLLEAFPKRPALRFVLYGLLEQISLPPTTHEAILEKMDENKDLDHPLAFQLTRALATRADNSPWIQKQQLRRTELLSKLEGDAQVVFDNFPTLMKESKGLVYHDNPLNPVKGKIGMEIEFNFGDKSLDSRESDEEPKSLEELSTDWEVGYDSYGRELRRNSDSLEHNTEYVDSFIPLYKWYRDHVKYIKSLHIHLDQKRHPHKPSLGKLFSVDEEDIKNNDGHNTWEVRCLNVPRGVGNLHPGRLEDLIGMYIYTANTPTENTSVKKLQIHDSKDVTFEKILLGHIFTHIQDPKGRLAAIMAMHDSAALHNCTPAAFFNTYDRVSLPIIANGLKDSFQNKDDIEWLNILKVFDQSTLENSWNSMSRNIKTGFAKVFTNEPIQFYKILDLSFSDRDSRVRESALDYFIKDISIFRKELIEATKDREPHIRETALEALLNDPLVENSIFIHALSDRDDGVKLNGIRKILQHPDLYHQQLVSLASDPNYILQWKAIEGLAADSGKGREFLENYIMRNDDDDWSANVAWEYLKSANNLRKKFLFKCLFHKDKAFREMAFNTLSSFFSIEI